MNRQKFINEEKSEPNIKDPELEFWQLWDSIEAADFGSGEPLKYSLLLMNKNPLTGKWIVQVNNYQQEGPMTLLGVHRLEITKEDLYKGFEFNRLAKPRTIHTQPLRTNGFPPPVYDPANAYPLEGDGVQYPGIAYPMDGDGYNFQITNGQPFETFIQGSTANVNAEFTVAAEGDDWLGGE